MQMRVLIISVPGWKDDNSFGNTVSNFFGGWEKEKISHLYCRLELPSNDVCQTYYSITEKDIIKNFITPWKIGKEIRDPGIPRSTRQKNNEKAEKKMLDFFRKNPYSVFLFARELIWSFGSWKNRKLDKFLTDTNPDIIFCFATEIHYINKLLIYCKTKSFAKLVLFFADDTYSYKSYSPLKFLYRFISRRHIKKIVSHADKIYGASPKLCQEYSCIFNTEIAPLYKGCFFEKHEKKVSISSPIKIVYAGNLFYGRWEILKLLADEIERINTDSEKMFLEIYTTATITHEIDKALNRGPSSCIMGALPYEDIKKVLQKADIVLHVESFEPKQIKSTRLSFSTKIIDCMQSGSCMMAIGPSSVASIQYLSEIEGSIVVDDLNKLREVLKSIINNPNIIIENAEKLNQYARVNHNLEVNRDRLKNDFREICNSM